MSRKVEIRQDAKLYCDNAVFTNEFLNLFYHYQDLNMSDWEKQIFCITDIRELKPNDSHKSFYKKAYFYTGVYTVDTDTECRFKLLVSYDTPIAVLTEWFYKGVFDETVFFPFYYGGYEKSFFYFGSEYVDYIEDISPTTLRHIKAAFGLSKNEYKQIFNDVWLEYIRHDIHALQ